jgi:predicted DCC family thiol-disulfide oxidoreductase YuxK
VAEDGVTIVYDGQCPFCAGYARLVRLREVVGPVRLVDARSDAPEARAARALGFDLDAGMLVRFAGADYHGADAMRLLGLLGSGSDLTSRLTRGLFGAPRRARFFYPVLAAGRWATLRLLGRRRIAEDAADGA